MPITTFFLNRLAIFKTSIVQFGVVKSIITEVFLKAFIEFFCIIKFPIFLFSPIFPSVTLTICICLFFLIVLINCVPILPRQPVIETFNFFIFYDFQNLFAFSKKFLILGFVFVSSNFLNCSRRFFCSLFRETGTSVTALIYKSP